jgi:hypothetical protein
MFLFYSFLLSLSISTIFSGSSVEMEGGDVCLQFCSYLSSIFCNSNIKQLKLYLSILIFTNASLIYPKDFFIFLDFLIIIDFYDPLEHFAYSTFGYLCSIFSFNIIFISKIYRRMIK